MVLVSELCDLPLNADGTPRRKFFRREAREYGVMLKCRKANFPRDALRNRPACIEPFYVVSDRQKGFSLHWKSPRRDSRATFLSR